MLPSRGFRSGVLYPSMNNIWHNLLSKKDVGIAVAQEGYASGGNFAS